MRKKYFLSENLNVVLNVIIFLIILISNTLGFFSSKPKSVNPSQLQLLCYKITGISLIINLSLITISFFIKKYRLFEIILVLFAGFIMFPLVTLTSKYPSETIIFEFIIPVLYSISSLKSSIKIFFLSITNMILLGFVNYYQMFKMRDVKISHIPSIVCSYCCMYFIIAVVAVIISAATKEMIKKEKEMKEKYKNIAKKDNLTKIYNRFGLNDAISFDRKCFAIMLDIDFFKNVNDTFGHDIGDEILVKVANVLINKSSENFIVSRQGGEEFLFVSYLSKQETISICEDIRKTIEKKVILPDNKSITVSIGISNFGKFSEELIKEADGYLYYSKTNGRNMVSYKDF